MPKQSEIKQEELQEFWEWCGCSSIKPLSDNGATQFGLNPNGQLTILRLDLNNLFKYAVPEDCGVEFAKIQSKYPLERRHRCILRWHEKTRVEDSTTYALALYQAIQKARRTNEQD